MAKEIDMMKNGLYTYWSNGERGMVNVDVYEEPRTENNKPILEWSYPKVAGASILGNASFWLDQALLQADGEREREVGPTHFDARFPNEPNPDTIL